MFVGVRNFFFFQAEDGIRDLVRSRGLGDVYKRQVYELFKANTNSPIGELAGNANIMGQHCNLSGFVVNEVVAWSFKDTCDHDNEHGTTYERDWCQEARNAGYIYLVDFAGYGKIEN